jgi:hypothetical protein
MTKLFGTLTVLGYVSCIVVLTFLIRRPSMTWLIVACVLGAIGKMSQMAYYERLGHEYFESFDDDPDGR